MNSFDESTKISVDAQDETADLFAYSRNFKIDRRSFKATSENFATHDELRIETQWRSEVVMTFGKISNADKTMIADSIGSDKRWLRILENNPKIVISRNMIESIYYLINLGVSADIASTIVVGAHCRENTTPEIDVTDIYKSFTVTLDRKYFPESSHDELVMIYMDLCFLFSSDAADNIFKVTRGSGKTLERTHRDLTMSIWPECSQYIEKVSARGLEIVRGFRLEHLNGSTAWIPHMIRVISELTDLQIMEASRLALKLEQSNQSVRNYHYFFYKYSTSLNSERAWISALMLMKYGMETLSKADAVLSNTFSVHQLSLDKLITVTDFVHNGGDADEIPIYWILEF